MSWKTKVADWLFADVIQTKVQQAVSPWAFGMDPAMAGFRRLTKNAQDQAALRDLPQLTHERAQEIAYYLYLTNPMAQWFINTTKNYVVGKGVTLKCEDERTQAVVDAWWKDPVNAWPKKLGNKVRELGLYGEQCWPIFTAPGTGRVRLGYLDPCLINEVILDPDNAEQPIGLITKQWTGYATVPERRYLISLNVSDDELNAPARRLRDEMVDGSCFYSTVNKVSNGTRGWGDLLAKADWLDGYERFMFNRLERSELGTRILYDLELAGFTQPQVDEFAKTFKLPNPGGVHIHNDKVKLDVKAPDMKADDAAVDARLFKHQCLAPMPEHWFAGGGDANRATAAEMDEPTYKHFEDRQTDIKGILEDAIGHQIRTAKAFGTLEQSADETIDIIFPEMVKADLPKLGSSFQTVTAAASAARAQGLLTKVEARTMIAVAAKMLGIKLKELSAEELDQQLADENFRDAAQDYLNGRTKPGAGADTNGTKNGNGKRAYAGA